MLTTLMTIALLHWVVLVTPGANVLVVSSLAAAGSRQAAVFAALGVALVTVVWATLAVVGVHTVFAAHPALRLGVQVAGGCYLLHVGWRLWRASGAAGDMQPSTMTRAAAFRLGFLTNIMNPKSALFFGSVFATALPAAPTATLLVLAVGLVVVNSLAWHLFLAVAFSHPRLQAVYTRRRRLIGRASAALVGAFGARLLHAAVAEWRAR